MMNLFFGRSAVGFPGLVGSTCCVFCCTDFKIYGPLIFDADLMSSLNSVPVFTGFLSVVHDSKTEKKFFVKASVNFFLRCRAWNYSWYT